jgi:hypothetical protein
MRLNENKQNNESARQEGRRPFPARTIDGLGCIGFSRTVKDWAALCPGCSFQNRMPSPAYVVLCCVVSAGKIIKSATFVKCPESSLVAGLSPHRISSANGSKLSARRPPCQAHESGQLPACILLSTSVMAPPSTPMLPTQARLLSVRLPGAGAAHHARARRVRRLPPADRFRARGRYTHAPLAAASRSEVERATAAGAFAPRNSPLKHREASCIKR